MPIIAEDQSYFLRVVDRSYPGDYIASIKAKPNGGYELFQSAAAVSARVSLAIARKYTCSFIFSAEGPARATGAVEFYRATAAAGAINLLAGTRVGTDDGREFITTQTAAFGALALGPITVAVQAVSDGYEYNVPGQVTTAGGETLEGEIKNIVRLVTDVPTIDPAMRVRQLVATSGGQAACLDGLGADVDIERQVGEDDASYRVRIRTTPDTVSPGAIQRGLDAILGVHACLREVGTSKFPGFFYDAGSSADSPQDPAHNFAYDMDFTARPEDRFKLYLDFAHFRGYMLIGIPPVAETNHGLFYDGSLADLFPLQNAYDTTATNAPDANYDGVAMAGVALAKAVYDMVNAKRAAGVLFDLYLETSGCT